MHPLMLEILPWVRQGYCCSQLLALLALEAQGRGQGPESAPLLRAMHGLCHGLGQSGGPCGLLTGGACVLGLLAGRGGAAEQAHPYFTPLVNEYAEWFYARTAAYGGHSCTCVLEGLRAESQGCPAKGPCCAGGETAEVGPDVGPGVGPAGGAAGETSTAALPDPSLCGGLLAACWEKIITLADAYGLDMGA